MALVPPHIARLAPYVPGKPIEELERELGVREAIKLASNENPVGPSPKAIAAATRALATANRYPDAAAHRLRARLAAKHDVSMDEITVGNGSNELIDLIARTFATPADHAVFAEPSFVCYAMSLTAANVPFTKVPLRDHVTYDVGDLLAAVTPATKLLFLANPNNPTGTYLPKEGLERLARELAPEVLLVADEAYVEFPDAKDFASALPLRAVRERLLVLRTFSKAYGLAALRVGYAIAPREVVDYLNRVRAPFNVNTPGQEAALAALEDEAHVERYLALNRTERTRMEGALRERGLAFARSATNFIFVNTGRAGRPVYEALLRRGVIVRPMAAPIDTWLRISIGLPEENDRLLTALDHVLTAKETL